MLKQMPIGTLTHGMQTDFRDALIWHMEQHGTTIADLVSATGVTRSVINKLLGKGGANNQSTSVENGMLIAAYYGKTVNQFILRQDVGPEDRLQTLAGLLPQSERRLVEAQIEGLLSRARRQKPTD